MCTRSEAWPWAIRKRTSCRHIAAHAAFRVGGLDDDREGAGGGVALGGDGGHEAGDGIAAEGVDDDADAVPQSELRHVVLGHLDDHAHRVDGDYLRDLTAAPDPLANLGKGADDVPGERGADEEVLYLGLEAAQPGFRTSQLKGLDAQILLGDGVGGAQPAAAVVHEPAQRQIGLRFGKGGLERVVGQREEGVAGAHGLAGVLETFDHLPFGLGGDAAGAHGQDAPDKGEILDERLFENLGDDDRRRWALLARECTGQQDQEQEKGRGHSGFLVGVRSPGNCCMTRGDGMKENKGSRTDSTSGEGLAPIVKSPSVSPALLAQKQGCDL